MLADRVVDGEHQLRDLRAELAQLRDLRAELEQLRSEAEESAPDTKRASMREGPAADLFRPTVEPLEPPEVEGEIVRARRGE